MTAVRENRALIDWLDSTQDTTEKAQQTTA
jgi:hypothetical protein